MNTITVSVPMLLDTLRKNRDSHRATFEKALVIYKTKAIEVFTEQIEAIHKGALPDRSLRLPCPEEHTDDYDRLIKMMEWHTDPTVELSMAEFTQYVMDNWGWKQSFITNTTSYTQ